MYSFIRRIVGCLEVSQLVFSLVAKPKTVLEPSTLQLKQGNKIRGIQYAHTVRAYAQPTSALLLKTTSSICLSSNWLGYATAAWSITV